MNRVKASRHTCVVQFQETYMSTVGLDFKIRTVEVGDKLVKLQMARRQTPGALHRIAMQLHVCAELRIALGPKE